MNALVIFALVFVAYADAQTACGTQTIAPVFPFIVGGTEAVKGSYPWQANLRAPSRFNPTGYYQFCGGTLINDQWILTAGHCWYGTKDRELDTYAIGMGYHHVDGTGDEEVAELFGITTLFMHEGYNDNTLANDIALLKLDRKVTFSDHITPACLPSSPVQDACLSTPIITGWGDTENTGDATYLQQVQVPYIDSTTCNQRLWYDGEVFDEMFCAGYADGGVDTCQGDSGGPLVCQEVEDGAYYVHGITSWGYGCADARKPGVYTRTSFFRAWIDNIVNNN